MKKVALITGIAGQDGWYLGRLLLSKGYLVHGLIRPKNTYDSSVIADLSKKDFFNKMVLHSGDLRDFRKLKDIVLGVAPDEIYNLGAQSNIDIGDEKPVKTYDVNSLGVLRLLEIISKNLPNCKLFQAGSIMQFSPSDKKISEKSVFKPVNEYAKSKQLAYNFLADYRNKYNLFCCCGFLSNHESPFRNEKSLSKNIIKKIVKCYKKELSYFSAFNINYKRYWGHASDYAEAMWLMMQNNQPEDFIISTNLAYTLKDFCTIAFDCLKMPIHWQMKGGQYYACNKEGKLLIKGVLNDSYKNIFRCVSNCKIKNKLKWRPRIDFRTLIQEMLDEELYAKEHH